MTEPRSEAWTASAEPTPAEPTEDMAEPEPDDDEPITRGEARKLRREAARLRTRLHDAEEEIAGFAAREGARQRADVEAIASEILVDPQDIWRSDPQAQQEFVDSEFHEITRDRIIETAKLLAQSKPHLAKPNAAPPPSDRPIEGLRPGAAPEVKSAAVTWASALRGR